MRINDRGGVLGRRLNILDCDDGPGEVARAMACIKKLAGQDKVFSLITGVDWVWTGGRYSITSPVIQGNPGLALRNGTIGQEQGLRFGSVNFSGVYGDE